MEVPQGDTYHIHFTTRSFSTGAPTALTSGTFAVYEESTATPIQTTQALTASINSVTGLNLVSVVATSGNGYDVGSYYNVSLDAGTVGGVSVVGEVIGHFRCVEPEGVAGMKEVNVAAWNDTALATTNPLPNAAAGAAGGLPTDSTGKTSFNDIAATAIVSSGAITTSGGAVSTVTAVTNDVGVNEWNGVALSTTNPLPNAVAGAAGGIFIAGTNAATTVTTALTTTFTGNLTGSVGSVTGLTASNLDATVSSRMAEASISTTGGAVDTVTTVTDLTVTARAEPAQGAPVVNTNLATKIDWLFKHWRNKKTNDGSVTNLYNDAGSVVDSKQTTSEAGGTVTKEEWATGP